MLSEIQCMKLEKVLTEKVDPRKLSAYLLLHMGLSVAEDTPLKVSDIDFDAGTLRVNKTIFHSPEKRADCQIIAVEDERVLKMPAHVKRLFEENMHLYTDEDCFIVNGSHQVSGTHLLQNALISLNNKHHICDKLTPSILRDAFTRRCLECGVDMYTVAEYLGLKQVNYIQKRFKGYLKANQNSIEVLEKYSHDYVAENEFPRRMNLLILGAGTQGRVEREIAEDIGIFSKIAFLDDDPENEMAIDSCSNYRRYVNRYPLAIPSFGDCRLRGKWADKLEEAGFILVSLIHPTATISQNVELAEGITVEPKAVIGNGVAIQRNAIVSTGSVVAQGSFIEENVHLDCSCTIPRDSRVPAFAKVSEGAVFDVKDKGTYKITE